ncbi:sugar ABC transporter substrate-binding protein [Xylanivirga thermophila]|uniref:sugar ABC transporter substrate-binding protein n=1 Tax=Xylanivirga thermophila TaxID=2496273 RepID=UPI00101C22D6|nr:maltose ABC transporter substrate-binding protein [Xylanivirga thermophila]
MKKSISIILVVMLLLSLSLIGCSNDNKGNEVDKPDEGDNQKQQEENNDNVDEDASDDESTEGIVAEDGATLKLWMDNDDYNEKIVEAWNKEYPDIELTVENVGTTDARSKLELDGPAGVGADVFVTAHDQVGVAVEAGLILENDLFADYVKESFMESAIPAVTYKGKIYGFPLSVKTVALFYNKDLVDKPAETWEDMLEFAKKFNDTSQNKFAMVWQANEPYQNHGFLAGYGYKMFGSNGEDVDQLGWDTEEAIEGMKFYQKLKELYPVPAQDADWDAMTSMFSGGNAAYAITGPWSINDFEGAGINFGITKLPKLPNGNYPISFSTVDVACVSSYTEYPNAAKLLAKFLSSDEALKILYETKRELPASLKAQELPEIKDDIYLAGVAEQAESSIPMPLIAEMGSVWDPYKKALTAVWDEIQDPETALKAAQEEFYSAIGK